MKRKNKKTVIIVFCIIVALVLGFFGTLYYITSTINNYSYEEKDWINANTDKSIDIYVEPNLPVFTSSGKGVYYDYLSALKADTGLNLNIITTDTADVKLINKNTTDADDIVFFIDHYIVVGEESTVDKLEDLENKKIGIISTDKENVEYYLTNHPEIEIVEHDDITALDTAYENKLVDYIVLPMYKYLDVIVKSESVGFAFL